MDGPRDLEDGGFQWGSATNDDGSGPAVYVFSNNDVPNIRDTGTSELTTKCRSSFDPEPHWLDDPAWYGNDGRSVMSEVKVEGPHSGEASFQPVSGTNAHRTTDDARNTGAPELATNFCSTFDPEPHSLDDRTWDDDDGRSVMSGVKAGLRLDSTRQ